MSEQMILIPISEYEQLIQKTIAASKTIATVELKSEPANYHVSVPPTKETETTTPYSVVDCGIAPVNYYSPQSPPQSRLTKSGKISKPSRTGSVSDKSWKKWP